MSNINKQGESQECHHGICEQQQHNVTQKKMVNWLQMYGFPSLHNYEKVKLQGVD